MYEPIPFEFLKTHVTKPQVAMTVGDLPVVCTNLDCDYEYIEAEYDMTSFSFNDGTGELSMSGTLPESTDDIVSITFGNSPCTGASISGSTITCSTSEELTVEAGEHKPILKTEMGDVEVTADAEIIGGSFSEISPLVDVNPLGNDLVTITGTNFPNELTDDMSVEFSIQDGQEDTSADPSVTCSPVSSTATSIVCRTSPFN